MVRCGRRENGSTAAVWRGKPTSIWCSGFRSWTTSSEQWFCRELRSVFRTRDIIADRLFMPRSQIVRLSLACLAATLSANAQVILTGRVVDQNDAPVANARVSAHRGPQAPVDAYSGPSGGFRLSLPEAGAFLSQVDRAGYFALKDRSVEVSAPGSEITLVINQQEEVFQ